VKVFSDVAGPVILKKPLLVPPLVPSKMLELETPPFAVEPKLIGGMSAETKARKVGWAATPVVGPMNPVLADWVFNV